MESKSLTSTVPYRVRLNRSMADRLAALAKQEAEPQTVIVRQLLREGLDRRLRSRSDQFTPAGTA
jgi:hypothetical protein